jgi:predicted outer membrane repeat protein
MTSKVEWGSIQLVPVIMDYMGKLVVIKVSDQYIRFSVPPTVREGLVQKNVCTTDSGGGISAEIWGWHWYVTLIT